MASSRYLITSTTLSSSASSVTFSSIPATYTDLILKISARCSATGNFPNRYYVGFNGGTSNLSGRTLLGYVYSGTGYAESGTTTQPALANATDSTSNTFASTEVYIPSYLVSQNKPFSVHTATEYNAADYAQNEVDAMLWSNTSAITSITLSGITFVSGSTFTLYGLKNS